jgi:hypothetical protein
LADGYYSGPDMKGGLRLDYASLAGNPPVEIAMGLRRLFQVELLGLDRLEWPGGNEFLHVPVEMTAITQTHLQPIQSALPFLDIRLRAEAMLQKQESPAWFENPVHFVQRLADVLDAAQGKRADDAIEGAVLEGEPFAAENPLVNLDLRLLDSTLGQFVHSWVRIDQSDLADLGRVMMQVQAGPETDLQNVAVSRGQQSLPMFGKERPVHEEVTKAREDYP